MEHRTVGAGGENHRLPLPLHCEWAWRAPPWAQPLQPASVAGLAAGAALAAGVTLHHDDPSGQVRYAQCAAPAGPAPFALALEAAPFAGSFLSLAIDLPAAARPLLPRHLLGVRIALAPLQSGAVYLRLNIRHGPNTAQLLRALDAQLQGDGPTLVEFDLAYARFNARRVAKVWCDVILAGPGPLATELRELAFTRRPRAEI